MLTKQDRKECMFTRTIVLARVTGSSRNEKKWQKAGSFNTNNKTCHLCNACVLGVDCGSLCVFNLNLFPPNYRV